MKKDPENKTESDLSEDFLSSEPFQFISGVTCLECSTRFPSALVLQDRPSQCPHCGTTVKKAFKKLTNQ